MDYRQEKFVDVWTGETLFIDHDGRWMRQSNTADSTTRVPLTEVVDSIDATHHAHLMAVIDWTAGNYANLLRAAAMRGDAETAERYIVCLRNFCTDHMMFNHRRYPESER